jgi:hypothetical protein
MRLVAWMIALSVTSWAAIALFVERASAVAALWGMLGPLAIACGSWLLAERTYRRDPSQLTSLMIAAFMGKMLVFAVYVAVMVKGLSVRFVPFMASFSAYFIGLYLIEALSLRRLFAS